MAAWCCCGCLCASRSAGWLSSPAGRQQERSDAPRAAGSGAWGNAGLHVEQMETTSGKQCDFFLFLPLIVPCFSSSVLKSSCPEHCPCCPSPPPCVPSTPPGDGCSPGQGAGEVPAQDRNRCRTGGRRAGSLQQQLSLLAALQGAWPFTSEFPPASSYLPQALAHSRRQHPFPLGPARGSAFKDR